MAFDARVLDVLIASPGDVQEARDAVEQVCYSWNGSRSSAERVTLRPRRWEADSVPLITGNDPQSVLNRQLVDSADIVVVIFHTRLGTPTRRAAAGTVEELTTIAESGKPVHVYFSTQKIPHDVDVDQLRAVRAFKRRLTRLGLVAEFRSLSDLKAQVTRSLEYDVRAILTLPNQNDRNPS